MPPADGVGALLRTVYGAVYAPQDRLVESFVEGRLQRLRGGKEARLAYHDRATLAVLHNLGLSEQMTVLALCLALGRPELYLWFVLACGLALLPLELRRELRALRAGGEPRSLRPKEERAC